MRVAAGDPSPPVPFSGDASTAQPCVSFTTENPDCFNDHPFQVPPNEPGVVDNAQVTVRIDWPTPASDWDLRVFRDSDGDGSSVGETEVASSGQGLTNFEEAAFGAAGLESGAYVARVINWAALEPYEGQVTFEGPTPPVGAGEPEAWNLTCEVNGEVMASLQVFVGRGERQAVDLAGKCKPSKSKGNGKGKEKR